MRPLGKVKISWSRNFSYAIGLIATDGCLYNNGRHINFTSKDKELVEAFRDALGVVNKIGKKSRGSSSEKRYFQVQLGDVLFHRFLGSIGLHPAKSKTITSVQIPNAFFFDFFRGCIDGDGSIGANSHPESKHLQLRLRLVSASQAFLCWLLERTHHNAPEIKGGWVSKNASKRVYSLAFGKSDTIKILQRMYRPLPKYYLERKYVIAKSWMGKQ